MGQPKLTREDILAVLRRVTFLDRQWILSDKGDGFLLQCTYMEEDIITGKLEPQNSRKHYISPYMMEDEIVDTCFLCIMRSFEHVAREHFRVDGQLVQSPHFSLAARIEMCERGMFAARDPVK